MFDLNVIKLIDKVANKVAARKIAKNKLYELIEYYSNKAFLIKYKLIIYNLE